MSESSTPRRVTVALTALVAVAAPAIPAFAAPTDPSSPNQPGARSPSSSSAHKRETTRKREMTHKQEVTQPEGPTEAGPLPNTPPPVRPGQLPPPIAPHPDASYRSDTQCVSSHVGGPVLADRPWAQDALQIDAVHKFVTGAGEKIAVIDTGVNASHPFFQDRVKPGGDYVSGDNGIKDCDGHGTIVAGIIAANTHPGRRNSNIGFDGMAPDASILSIRQTSQYYKDGDGDNARTAGTTATLAQAVSYAASQPDIDAINISLTSCVQKHSPMVDANYHRLQAAVDYAVNAKDKVVVAAAGNYDPNNGCKQQNDNANPNELNSITLPPWFADDVLSVASIGRNGDPSSFSIAGPWVSVAAPGEDIISLDPAGNSLVNQRSESPSSQPGKIQGTSFAAPYVTGLVALVRQKYPDLTAHQVMHRIEATAQHPADSGGRNNQVGYGPIDPLAALTAVIPGESGVTPAKAKQLPANIPPPYQKDWTPTVVALAGTGTGLGLLLLTVFIMRTVQRNRRRRAAG